MANGCGCSWYNRCWSLAGLTILTVLTFFFTFDALPSSLPLFIDTFDTFLYFLILFFYSFVFCFDIFVFSLYWHFWHLPLFPILLLSLFFTKPPTTTNPMKKSTPPDNMLGTWGQLIVPDMKLFWLFSDISCCFRFLFRCRWWFLWKE